MGTMKLLCVMAMVVASHSTTIRRRTIIRNKPEDLKVAAGSPVTFPCTPDTDPELLAEVTWEFMGSPIDFNSRIQILNDFSLHITSAVANDSGSYVCVVKTPFDEARAQGSLMVQDKPNPPSIDGVECKEKFAVLRWNSTGDNHAYIRSFTIQYITNKFTTDGWEIATEVPGMETSWNMELGPGSNYTFRVIAHNEIGTSQPSERSEVCLTQPDVPYMNPYDVKGCGTRPDNMVISWSIMPPTEHNGPGFHYKVSYKRDAPGETWIEHIVTDWTQSELVVPNTPTFTRYLIKVAAVNTKGPSRIDADEVVGWSGEDTPLLAPTNFTLVEVISSNMALFSWHPVPRESLRGHLLGYRIQTWTNRNEIRNVVVSSNTNEALINILEPFKKNYVRVIAYNRYASGPPSEIISFLTPQGTPGPVKSFNAYPLGDTAMMLSWEKPEAENGILTGYKVYYAKVMDSQVGPMLQLRKIIDPKFHGAKLSNLEPDMKYRIWIHALTETGEGRGVFVEQTTEFDRFGALPVPDAPHFETSMLANKTGDMLVHWLPALDGHPGTHFQVSYRPKGKSQWTQTPIEFNDDYVVIMDLEP